MNESPILVRLTLKGAGDRYTAQKAEESIL
jgi:hypothetical protein